MQVKPRVLEQQIAVFGESGSGKTVLVSSFYGATQEPQFLQSSLFNVTADDTGQGHQLHANYLGMKDSRRPSPTRFSATPYAFSLKLRDKGAKANSPKPFDALRLVWHDYPGEWFEGTSATLRSPNAGLLRSRPSSALMLRFCSSIVNACWTTRERRSVT